MRTYLLLSNKSVLELEPRFEVVVTPAAEPPGLTLTIPNVGDVAVLIAHGTSIGELGDFLSDVLGHLFYIIRDIEGTETPYEAHL